MENSGGGRLSAMGLLMLGVVVIGIFLAHRTRFGNQVYAIGGNATSANLMGISTRSTTIRIYMLSTGLATLAGIVFSIYTRRVMRWRALALSWMRLPQW